MDALETEPAHGDALAQSLADEVLNPPRRLESFSDALDLVLANKVSVHVCPAMAAGHPALLDGDTVYLDGVCSDRERTTRLMQQFGHILLLRRHTPIAFNYATVVATQFAALVIP